MDFNEVVIIACLAIFELLVGITIGRNMKA